MHKVYLYRLIAVSLYGAALFTIFIGLQTDEGSLGISNMCVAGLLLGFTQIIGNLSIIPFINKMKRVFWATFLQILLAISALAILILSLVPQNSTIETAKALISTCLMSTIISAGIPLLFIFSAELFPTEIRGSATALILTVSNLLSALAPVLGSITLEYGIHQMVGCSIFLIPSIPFVYFLKETLAIQSNKSTNKSDYNCTKIVSHKETIYQKSQQHIIRDNNQQSLLLESE